MDPANHSSFLDDGKNTELIRWSDRGDSFVVLDEDEFAKTLIPELFKHNNYASFVRQLNMYGFHKRVGLSDNSMKASERKNKSPSEYSNPYFKRGHPNLLWLINKPKNPQKKGKGGRTKQEEGADESDEDNRDGLEETYGYGQDQHIGRALSAAPEAGQPGPVALTLVQKQLRDIQQQQNNISNMIARLRKEHNDLYSQAVAFQTLHDRHESSINAILTFLATVYNRSLDGQGGGNIAQMFANAIPQDQHNVVDLGNINAQGAGNLSPMRRQQRLLMAPPNAHQPGSISPASSSSHGAPPPAPSSSGSNYARATTTGTSPRSGAIEELFEVSPGHSPQSQQGLKREHHASLAGTPPSATTGSPSVDPDAAARGPAQQNIMELINTTNARVPRHRDMAFPDVLHHYENANGASPLTHQQRADMLHLIASSSAGAAAGPGGGGMGALVDQHAHHPQPQPQQHGQQQQQQHAPPPQQPPPMLPLSPGGGLSLGHSPSLAQLGYTQAEIEELVRMQREQDSKISEVSSLLGPLTPGGGGIPGGGGYFGDGGAGDGAGGNNLDLDQFLDAGAYYNDDDGGAAAAAAAGAGGGFGAYDGFVDQTMGGGLDFGMDAVGVGPGVGSPMEMGEGEGEEVGREGSPKRRRKG